MSSQLPVIAFLSSSLLAILYEQSRSKNESSKLEKDQVLQLRQKHFMESVSVSYSNSGGLMIVGVSFLKYI
jgi:hypothetical protein